MALPPVLVVNAFAGGTKNLSTIFGANKSDPAIDALFMTSARNSLRVRFVLHEADVFLTMSLSSSIEDVTPPKAL